MKLMNKQGSINNYVVHSLILGLIVFLLFNTNSSALASSNLNLPNGAIGNLHYFDLPFDFDDIELRGFQSELGIVLAQLTSNDITFLAIILADGRVFSVTSNDVFTQIRGDADIVDLGGNQAELLSRDGKTLFYRNLNFPRNIERSKMRRLEFGGNIEKLLLNSPEIESSPKIESGALSDFRISSANQGGDIIIGYAARVSSSISPEKKKLLIWKKGIGFTEISQPFDIRNDGDFPLDISEDGRTVIGIVKENVLTIEYGIPIMRFYHIAYSRIIGEEDKALFSYVRRERDPNGIKFIRNEGKTFIWRRKIGSSWSETVFDYTPYNANILSATEDGETVVGYYTENYVYKLFRWNEADGFQEFSRFLDERYGLDFDGFNISKVEISLDGASYVGLLEDIESNNKKLFLFSEKEINSDLSNIFPNEEDLDSDGDDIPDDWEVQYFGEISITDGLSDSDGDGISDGSEYITGHSPIDPQDRFCIIHQEFDSASSKITLTMSTKDNLENRRYRILHSKDLNQSSWLTLLSVPPFLSDKGTITQKSFIIPEDSATNFFKIECFIEE